MNKFSDLVKKDVPIVSLDHPVLSDKGVQVDVLRLDLVNELASGNKFFKLKYNIETALERGFKSLLTFGGAYSNHLYATAATASALGLSSVGIIRGERIEPLNNTLAACEAFGMVLHFVTRSEYREKSNPDFLVKLQAQFPEAYIIPEGGGNLEGVKGCMEIAKLFSPDQYDALVVGAGTGGTLAGLVMGLNGQLAIYGVPVLKGGDFIREEVATFVKSVGYGAQELSFDLWLSYHFGGYAKRKPELLAFIASFVATTDIVIEPVYTGKVMFALFDQIQQGFFKQGQKVLMIHTGGLQYLD